MTLGSYNRENLVRLHDNSITLLNYFQSKEFVLGDDRAASIIIMNYHE